MSDIQQHVDWTAQATPAGERVGPGLGRRAAAEPAGVSRRDVMETLLGTADLAAIDASGGDPYNATGRHFRR